LASEGDSLSDLYLLVPQVLFEHWSWSHRLHAATRKTLSVFLHYKQYLFYRAVAAYVGGKRLSIG
jgi:hypothetical protein